jgi:hypothetical protein
MNKKNMIFLHGLFGENISSPKDSKTISPYFLNTLSQIDIKSDDILIAYSFGARKLLSLIDTEGFPDIEHLHIVSAHLSCSDRNKRKELEDHMLAQMTSTSFLSFWNKLPLFEKDENIDINLDLLPFYREMFDQHRLSNSPDYRPIINKYSDKITLHCGELDDKIKKQYLEFQNVVIHKGCGHRGPIYKIQEYINGGQK